MNSIETNTNDVSKNINISTFTNNFRENEYIESKNINTINYISTNQASLIKNSGTFLFNLIFYNKFNLIL